MGLDRLDNIMKRLRDRETGCEWDSVQTFETIAPYTIEEAYEVADAIHRGDMDALVDEPAISSSGRRFMPEWPRKPAISPWLTPCSLAFPTSWSGVTCTSSATRMKAAIICGK